MGTQILGVSGSPRPPSRTSVLVGEIVRVLAAELGVGARLLELSGHIATLLAAGSRDRVSSEGESVLAAIEAAPVLVVGSPVYRASYSGLLKHVFDLIDYRALRGRPVVLAATAGSPLHGLVIEHQLRPLFGFFGALTVPTAVFATEADVSPDGAIASAIRTRIQAAVSEAASLALRRTPQAVP